MYDLSPVFGFDETAALEAGASVLLSGTDGTNTTGWLSAILADGLQNGDGAVIVSTDQPATAVLDELGDRIAVEPASVCVIDCQGGERTRRTLDDGVFVYSVSASDDLTGIGIGLAACFDRLAAAGYDRGRIGFYSLGSILDAAGEEAAFKFAHVVSSRLASAGFLGVFGLEQPHSPESKRILAEAFDRTVELREAGNGVKGRIRKHRSDPGAWAPVSVPSSDR